MASRKCGPNDFWVVVGLILMVAIPAGLTLHTVQAPRPLVPLSDRATPLGYTWSLLLFLIPDLVIGWRLLRLRESAAEQQAFGLTIALLVPAGFGLDVFFGTTFFTFENRAATLGWDLPGYVRGQGFRAAIPFEEFAFYALGFIAILLLYVWADRVWLQAYSPTDRLQAPRPSPLGRVWRRSVESTRQATRRAGEALADHPLSPVLVGGLLFFAAWWYQRHGPGPGAEGFPGYFLFLLVASVVPSVVCFRVAARLINWRAFGFSFLFMLLVSLFWEATLGVPYQWWGYRKEQMIGVFVGAFSDLPLEAVLVWGFATWTTVLVYETILLGLRTGARPLGKILLRSNDDLRRLREPEARVP